jgi:DNA-binding response OmpR family regulator
MTKSSAKKSIRRGCTQTLCNPRHHPKLRLPENKCEIELSNPVTINGIAIRNLTQSEDKLLRTLAENRGQLVATAKIAKTLWQEDASSKFSVYYFPKLVFTLRRKLVAAGISPKLVRSQSGADITLNEPE